MDKLAAFSKSEVIGLRSKNETKTFCDLPSLTKTVEPQKKEDSQLQPKLKSIQGQPSLIQNNLAQDLCLGSKQLKLSHTPPISELCSRQLNFNLSSLVSFLSAFIY